MVIVTGDKHGDIVPIFDINDKLNLSKNDIIIILGDAGYNFYLNYRDYHSKRKLALLDATIFCIHGNHECRPEHILSYKTKTWHNGMVWYEDAFPNLLFARDGDVFNFNGKNCLVIGGAYSIDKEWRILTNNKWWADEQPSDEIKHRTEESIKNNRIDIVLSHTCPYNYEPRDVFLPFIDQSKVDNSTERWLQMIESNLDYEKWYCGHFHIERKVDKIQFLFNSAMEL